MNAIIVRDKAFAFVRRFWPAILAVSAMSGAAIYLQSFVDVKSTVSDRKVSSGTVKRLNRQLQDMRDRLTTLARSRDYGPLDTRKPSALGPIKATSKPVRYTVNDNERSAFIARSPSEVIELQKRGDRDYQVFQLTPSKRFRRVGPIRVALRKTDSVHQRFDVEVKTNKVTVSKNGVNRLERINVPLDSRQSIELVVNHISDDQVVGYVGVPKGLETNASFD